MDTTSILAGIPATTVTVRIVDLAASAGLRPSTTYKPYRGLRRVFVDAGGVDGLFGCIDVSERTGKVVRAYLTHGNHGVERKLEKVAEIRAALTSWAAVQRTGPAAG